MEKQIDREVIIEKRTYYTDGSYFSEKRYENGRLESISNWSSKKGHYGGYDVRHGICSEYGETEGLKCVENYYFGDRHGIQYYYKGLDCTVIYCDAAKFGKEITKAEWEALNNPAPKPSDTDSLSSINKNDLDMALQAVNELYGIFDRLEKAVEDHDKKMQEIQGKKNDKLEWDTLALDPISGKPYLWWGRSNIHKTIGYVIAEDGSTYLYPFKLYINSNEICPAKSLEGAQQYAQEHYDKRLKEEAK